MNQAIKNGSTVAQAWQAHMSGCTVAAKQQAKQCLINKENLSELTSKLNQSTIAARAQAVALKAASIAGNMLAMLAISKGIEFVVKGIDDLVHASEKARETSKELTNEWINENDSINKNISKYKELKKS